jgi:hypothetical protein
LRLFDGDFPVDSVDDVVDAFAENCVLYCQPK